MPNAKDMQSLRESCSNAILPPERLGDEAFTPVGFGFTDATSKVGDAAVDCPVTSAGKAIVSTNAANDRRRQFRKNSVFHLKSSDELRSRIVDRLARSAPECRCSRVPRAARPANKKVLRCGSYGASGDADAVAAQNL